MSDLTPHEDREAMIIDSYEGSLGPDEVADAALLADILADPSSWAEPRDGLEDDIVRAVEHDTPTRAKSAWTSRRMFLLSAAAALVVIALGAVVIARDHSSNDFETHLRATELAPAARGEGEITHNNSGFRIEMYAHDLPSLHAGEYYQAWLKNPTGTAVPIGTFSSSDDHVTLWSGVSPDVFPTMTVTIESTDNNQASSGRTVLVGPVERN
jgi:Anti-sigma-K factor rskA